jgi:mRNA-degrading endonuclease toxin of MazEF toxin-antitoxin module
MPWNHTVGHEQAKPRPWVVISSKRFHRPFLDLVIAVPLTSQTHKAGQFRGARILVPADAIVSVDPRFVKQDQLALTEHVRSLSLARSRGKVGAIEQAWVDSIRGAVRVSIT